MRNFRNSDLIVPISIIIHLCIINGLLFLLTPETYLNLYHILFYNGSWLVIAYILKYYPVERKERFATNLPKVLHLYILYGLAYFSLFGISGLLYDSLQYQILIYLLICLCLTWYRVLFFWVRGKYRRGGGNSVSLIVIGGDGNENKIRKFFDEPELGYRFHGYFNDEKRTNDGYLGKVVDCFLYALENEIDEIYCVASQFNAKELQNLISFADNNLIKFKVILDNKQIFSRAMSIDLYGNVPVLNLREVPLDTEYARIVKRSFDIVFSSIVILFILSWLSPLLYILIKLESKGPLYFKQKRHGLKRKVFWCYKFRSMVSNVQSDTKMTTKNDARVTRMGNFMRKTSIDELPQFFNVFLGDMSVVGPRPHMMKHTNDYENYVDKYLVRHFVKPGITGLAQVKGYRGEIEKPADIHNRVRLDIFYVEKWSLRLDLKIILRTIANAVLGEDKAY